MASKEKAQVDPTEDVDDLDDILDEFNENKGGQTSLEKKAEGKIHPAADAVQDSHLPKDENLNEDELNERFAKELAQGMESLMKGMEPDSVASSEDQASRGVNEGGQENLFDEQEMMKQFEQMMADMGLSSGSQDGAQPASVPSASAQQGQAPPANFQDAIRNTMSRLRESDATATSNAGQTDEMDFEKLLAAMSNAEGGDSEEGIANMLESMMKELMSKEVLYDPLKELRDKYPSYLADPPAALSSEDRARYEKQYSIVERVVKLFEDPKFDNGTENEKQALKTQVQDLMNEMQDSGSPPPEIVGDLPPELEGMPGLGSGENCTVM